MSNYIKVYHVTNYLVKLYIVKCGIHRKTTNNAVSGEQILVELNILIQPLKHLKVFQLLLFLSSSCVDRL